VASAVYFSLYYTASSLGGYLPGLAWEAWRWAGVAALAWSALALAALALLARGATTRGRASGRRDASRR
jgi:hypothetical protein